MAPALVLFAVSAGTGAWRYAELPATLPTPNGVIVDATQRSAATVSYAFAAATGTARG